MGLNILVGLTGLVSLGQAGLFGLGAYTGAILAKRLASISLPPASRAIVVASLFGALLAYPTVRVRGVYLAVITIAFGLVVENVAIEWQSVTGGTTGLTGIPQPQFRHLAVGISLLRGPGGMLVRRRRRHAQYERSRYGRAMLAVSQSETAARALGINPTGMRTLAFVISAVTAGLAGGLYAFLNSYISRTSSRSPTLSASC